MARTQAGRSFKTRKETMRRMMMDPRTVERLLGYMSKAVWLIMAYSLGSMIGRFILLAR